MYYRDVVDLGKEVNMITVWVRNVLVIFTSKI